MVETPLLSGAWRWMKTGGGYGRFSLAVVSALNSFNVLTPRLG